MTKIEIEDYMRLNIKNLPVVSGTTYDIEYLFIYSNNHVNLYHINIVGGDTRGVSYDGNYGLWSSLNLDSDDTATLIGNVDFLFPSYTNDYTGSFYDCVSTSAPTHNLSFYYTDTCEDGSTCLDEYWYITDNGLVNYDYEIGHLKGSGHDYMLDTPSYANDYTYLSDAQSVLAQKFEDDGYPNTGNVLSYQTLRDYITCLLSKGDLCCIKKCWS